MDRTDHLLVVDDDPEIRDLLVQYLERAEFAVTAAASGAQMRVVLESGPVDLVVLDLMLPGEDGLAICRELRSSGFATVPILMLTARNEEADRVVGLEMGADDYLTKPFAPRELLARVRAILRRARMRPPVAEREGAAAVAGAGAVMSTRLAFGGWCLDTAARHLVDPSGTIVALSGAEYRLLCVFLEHAQRVLSREQLLNLTQGRTARVADAFDRSIDILVSRLRKRLRDDSREGAFIKTVRSEGYVFTAAVERRGRKA
jgi:two-component system OmpR family response regulator